MFLGGIERGHWHEMGNHVQNRNKLDNYFEEKMFLMDVCVDSIDWWHLIVVVIKKSGIP